MPCGHCDRWQRKYAYQKRTADIHRRGRKAAESALKFLLDPMLERYVHQDYLGERCACAACSRARAERALR